MNLIELKQSWQDTPEYHKDVHERFIQLVNGVPVLKEHRDYVETNIWGFGERSFWWLWKLILADVPVKPLLLEVGVFRAATLSLWKLLNPYAIVTGITPLDSSGGVWESNYADDIKKIHDDFNLPEPHILKGRSDNPKIITSASSFLYDVIYIDGDHSFNGCYFDLVNYAPLVKHGGYLVIDDACCDMKMEFGFFQGIADVTDATLKYISENNDQWEFICNVVHLRVYKRK
jgi:hypothetical protein